MNKLHLTIGQAVELLRNNVKGSEFVTVDLEMPLDSKMNKGGRACSNTLFGKGCFQKATMNGNLAGKYIEAVNRMLKRQSALTGEVFEPRTPKAHPWGDLDAKRIFRINRKSALPYLHLRIKNQAFGGNCQADGEPLTDEQAATFAEYKKERKPYGSSTQEGLEKKVMVKDFALANVRAIRMRGIEINIIAG